MSAYVLGISGSPRKDGNTDACVKLALDEIRARRGVETRFVRIADVNIKPCAGCRGCMKAMRCVIQDDDFAGLFETLMRAEALVIGAPVYWNGPPGVMKNFIDRTHTFYACPDKFPRGRRVVLISVSAGGPFDSHESIMLSWMRHYGMEIVGNACIVAREKGEALARVAEVEKLKELAGRL